MGAVVCLDHPSVSRRHAALVHHENGNIYIIDLASVSFMLLFDGEIWGSRSFLAVLYGDPPLAGCPLFRTLPRYKRSTTINAENFSVYDIERINRLLVLQRAGVLVNNAAIPPNKPTRLPNNSKITIGPYTYTVQCSAAPSKAAAAAPPSGPAQIRASHLLVKHKDVRRPSSWKEPVVTRTREEALAKVQAFRAEIASGQTDFATLASVESHCSSARKGGDLGWFGRGQMQRPFEEGAYALDVGQLSEPVFSDSGVHIILRTG